MNVIKYLQRTQENEETLYFQSQEAHLKFRRSSSSCKSAPYFLHGCVRECVYEHVNPRSVFPLISSLLLLQITTFIQLLKTPSPPPQGLLVGIKETAPMSSPWVHALLVWRRLDLNQRRVERPLPSVFLNILFPAHFQLQFFRTPTCGRRILAAVFLAVKRFDIYKMLLNILKLVWSKVDS